jgi:5'(3')-deoxyribonucleotidase
MVIGIDCDDVCCDFQSSYVRLLNFLFGRPPIGTAPIDWSGSNLQLTNEETKQSWTAVAKVPNFWADLKPLPSFDDETTVLLKRLTLQHDVYFVTNRFATPGSSPMKQTKHWFRTNARIEAPNVMIAKDKGPMASVLQLDAFIDDKPQNCLDVLEVRPNARVYLCDCSHNQPFSDPRIPRVKDLKEFLKLILEAN